MSEKITSDGLKYIVARLMDNFIDAKNDYDSDKKNEYYAGRKIAYYEMLDILKTELDVREQDLNELGLNVELEKFL